MFWRARPPSIQQGILTCWSASISSFSRAVHGFRDFADIASVRAEFSKFTPGEINPDGSLKTPTGWVKFASRFSLHIQEIRIRDPLGSVGAASPGITDSIVADDLALVHFSSKLRRSHVIVVKGTSDPTAASHTVVVYGADKFRLCFMDPLRDPSVPTDPARSGAVPIRRPGGSGRAAENFFCETYNDFVDGPRYLLIWK
jgi:hypothetical protein